MKAFIRFWILTAALLNGGVLLAANPPTKAWLLTFDPGSGGVEFNATGRPSALKIHGKGTAPKGALSVTGGKASGTLSFDLGSLDTGIKMRNEHMKQKYLEVGKYQQAELTFDQLSMPESVQAEQAKLDRVPFQGTLSLHGIRKPVTGFADIVRDGQKVALKADFGIKLTDYGIAIPSFAGITVAEDVRILVDTSTAVTFK